MQVLPKRKAYFFFSLAVYPDFSELKHSARNYCPEETEKPTPRPLKLVRIQSILPLFLTNQFFSITVSMQSLYSCKNLTQLSVVSSEAFHLKMLT